MSVATKRSSDWTQMKAANLSRLSKALAISVGVCSGVAENDSVEAAIVAWQNANLVIPNNIYGLYINVQTKVTGTSSGSVAGWDINPYSSSALRWFSASGTGMLRYPGDTSGSAGSLDIGNVVGATGSFDSLTGAVTVGSNPGQWKLNADNYFGFRFVAADSLTHYGYGVFAIGSSISGADRMIRDIFWEDVAGASITVGPTGFSSVPEPGGLVALAAGLGGILMRRRRIAAKSPA